MPNLGFRVRDIVAEVAQSLRREPAFAVVVLITLAWSAVIGLMVFAMILQPGFLGMTHFSEPGHRVHDLTFGFLFAAGGLGLLAQLRRPKENLAGQWMALAPWTALLMAAVLSADADVIRSAETLSVASLTAVAVVLHPARRSLVRSLSFARVNKVLLALVAVAAVPLLVFASANIALQATSPDEHAAMRHYGFMAAFGFTVVAVGLVASLRPAGWRLTAWVAGLLPVLLGLASLAYPNLSSSLGPAWALGSMAWGGGFIAAAEATREKAATLSNRGTSMEPEEPAATAAPRPAPDAGGEGHAMPRWVKVFGAVAVVLVVLVAAVMVSGLGGQHGPGRHLPPAGDGNPPAGQAATGSVGGPAAAAEATRTVEVTTLDAMAFEPSSINVSSGEAVTFVVTNAGQAAHEFVLGDAAMQQQRASQRAHTGAMTPHDASNSVHVAPGETKQLTWRFGDPGTLEYACHEPGHYQAGMRGRITVAA